MADDLLDRIYDAAFAPDLWQQIIEDLSVLSNAASGNLIIFDNIRPVIRVGTGLSQAALESFSQSTWRQGTRIQHFRAHPFTGFVSARHYFDYESDQPSPELRLWRQQGLGDQLGTMIDTASGEIAVFAFDRLASSGPFERRDLNALDRVYPHLARSIDIASRLGSVRADASVAALSALGLSAALFTADGRMVQATPKFEARTDLFRAGVSDRLVLYDPGAQAKLQQAMVAANEPEMRRGLTIALPPQPSGKRIAMQLLPLRRIASEMFAGAAFFLVVTTLSDPSAVAATEAVALLLGLTPAEARLATGLAKGKSLRAIAGEMNISFSSARTYLARIFLKTDTRTQSQMVALVKSIPAPLRAETCASRPFMAAAVKKRMAGSAGVGFPFAIISVRQPS